jgi:hypothetical protein
VLWTLVLAAALPAAYLPASEVATVGNAQAKWASAGGWTYLALVVPRSGVDTVVVYRSRDGLRWALDGTLGRPSVRSALPGLGAGEDGTVHAAWVDYAGPGHVWYARRGPEGWSVGRKLSPGEAYAGFPAVAAGPDAVHVLWYGVRPSHLTPHGAVYEILHTTQARTGWTAPQVISPGVPDALNPSAAWLGTSLHAAWYQSDGRTYRVRHAMWSSGRWSAPQTVSSEGAQAMAVSLAASPSGLNAVWQQYEGATSRVVYRRRLPGGRWSEPVVLGEGTDPVVGATESTAVVVWVSGGRVRLRISSRGSWSGLQDVGEGMHPTVSSSEPFWVAFTRPSTGGYEVVVRPVAERAEKPGIAVWWLLALPAAYALARVLRRPRPIQGGNPR